MYNTDGKGKVWDRETGEIVLEIPMNEFDKWIAALRSGKYKQTQYRLQSNDGYCCLGVLCKEIMSKADINMGTRNFLFGIVPSDQKNASLWIKKINSVFGEIGFEKMDDMRQDNNRELARLNDREEMSFNEIADVLELTFKECAFNK